MAADCRCCWLPALAEKKQQ